MHHHPEPESHPPPLPVQRPTSEAVPATEAYAGDPVTLDGVHGRPSASTTVRLGRFADPPEDALTARQHRASSIRRRRDRTQAGIPAGAVPQLVSYVAVMMLLVLIWLLVGVSGGGWYPWPVWPALGWGVGLAIKIAAPRGVRCVAP